mgnify:CR=1 FL=1
MENNSKTKISVIIVNYNVKYYLEQCLYTVMKATNGMKREIFVFDNNSSDGSVEYLKLRYPLVTFISSIHNVGFARGNNTAIRQSTGEYVLLLNPDTFIGENVISDAIDFLDAHPDEDMRIVAVGEAVVELRDVPLADLADEVLERTAYFRDSALENGFALFADFGLLGHKANAVEVHVGS